MSNQSLLSKNPFRILGIQSTSGQREIKKNLSKLNAYAKLGRKMDMDYDLNVFNLSELERTTDILQKAENKLNLDQNKIKNSLFWFADISPIDSVALAHLIKGDVVKSIGIWEKATASKDVSLKNFSSFNNLSSLLLLNSLDDTKTDTFIKDDATIQAIQKAIKLKSEFFSSVYFKNYCDSICTSVNITSDDALEFFTSSTLELLNKNFSAKDLSNLFNDLDENIQDSINVSLTEVPVSNVEHYLESAAHQIEKNEKSGVKVGKQLIKDTLKDIKYLKEISSPDDFQFQTLSDNLSNQILQCGIICFNATGDDQDFLSSYKYALSIAISDKTKNRAKDCIKHCEEEKKANICPFCKSNKVEKTSPHVVEIYKVTSRDYSGVRYRHGPLELYQCKECLDSIQKVQTKKKRNGWIAATLCVLITIVMGDEDLFLPGFVCAVIAYFAVSALTLAFSSNIPDFNSHPVLRKHISEGWTTTQPTA